MRGFEQYNTTFPANRAFVDKIKTKNQKQIWKLKKKQKWEL